MCTRLLDEEEALEDLEDNDEDHDGKVAWEEYVKAHFSYTLDEISEMRRNNQEEELQFLAVRRAAYLLRVQIVYLNL